ncbi:MAG: hypothetical protein M1818_003873 [Claussenomyces sp. TS43310]|nr:MAG: hypothetical protein M1818_003873 [Claussenomyces sp. TS43310]
MARLAQKVVLVTGSSSGLGRAIALLFAAEGARLVVCADLTPASNAAAAAATAEDDTHERICRVFGAGRAVFVKCDVTIEKEVEAAVQLAVEKGGRLDVKLNTQGPFNGCKYSLAQFLKQDLDVSEERGRIVNVASAAGLKGVSHSATYCASKAAVIGMTKGMAIDYAVHKIHVNALCPGFLRTAMTKDLFGTEAVNDYMKSLTPYWEEGHNVQDVAKAALFLASPDARWLTGVALPVDGGFAAQ